MLVSTVQQSESAVSIHIAPLFWISFPSKPPQSIEQGSLCCAVASHLLSILYTCVWKLFRHVQVMHCSPPDPSAHGILQTIILEWVDVLFSMGSSWPRNRTWVSCTAGRFFIMWATREAIVVYICHFKSPCLYRSPFLFWYPCLFSTLCLYILQIGSSWLL